MIGRSSVGGFICQRCRIRREFWTVSHPQLLRSQSSFTAPLRRLPTAERHDEQLPDRHERNDDFRHEQNRMRSFRRGRRPMKIAKLGVKSLGKPTEVIVLNDTFEDPQRESSGDAKEPLVESSNAAKDPPRNVETDIFGSLEKLTRAPRQHEINEQIEKYRPSGSGDPKVPLYLDNVEFEALSARLRDGFTGAQLQRYIEQYKQRKETRSTTADSQAESAKGDGYRGLRFSGWQVNKVSLRVRLDDEGTMSQTYTQKMLIILRVLKECWNIALLDEGSLEGEFEVKLEEWQLEMLRLEKNSRLDTIGSQRQIRMAIYWPDYVLRISGKKISAEEALKDVDAVLKSCKTMKMDLTPFRLLLKEGQDLHNLFTERDLSYVAQITTTVISPGDKSTLVIHAADEDHLNHARSSLLEILKTASSMYPKALTNVAEATLQALPAGVLSSALKYKDRSHLYSRWTVPINKKSPKRPQMHDAKTHDASDLKGLPEESEVAASSNEVGDKVDEEKRANSQSPLSLLLDSHGLDRTILPDGVAETCQDAVSDNHWWRIGHDDSSYWSNIKKSTFATLGQLLHAQNGRTGANLQDRGVESSAARVFSSVFPGMSKMLPHLDSFKASGCPLHKDYLMFHYVPSPWSKLGFEVARKFPPIAVMFNRERSSDGTLTYVFYGMTATLNETTVDLALPTRMVDVRFHTAQRLYLHNPPHQYDERLKHFITTLERIVRDSPTLRGPPEVTFRLPEAVLRFAEGIKNIGLTAPGMSAEVDVEYLFTDVEHRELIRVGDRRSPAFTSVRGSALHGQRWKLHLTRTTAASQFVRDAVALADVAHAVATGVLRPPRRELPFYQRLKARDGGPAGAVRTKERRLQWKAERPKRTAEPLAVVGQDALGPIEAS